MYQVIYFSRGGNTKKLADAIAAELNVDAIEVNRASLKSKTGTLFLGSGCYGGEPGRDVLTFLNNNEFEGLRVALFGTSGGGAGRELASMSKILEEKGAIILGRFACKGKTFMIINRRHPDDNDLVEARRFARETIKSK